MAKRSNRLPITIKCLIIALIAVVFTVPFGAQRVAADSDIYLSLSGPSEEIHAGDVATITVTASSLEHITRFGPIDLAYNGDSLEFVSVWSVTELSAFTYTVDDSTSGHFIVSAVDQAVEADIAQNQLSGNADDPSIFFDSEVVLFYISFRVTSTSSSNIRFWIDSASGFRNSSMEECGVTIGDGVTVQVAPSLSDDASLSELSVDGVSFTPEFSADTLEYSCSVARNIDSISVNAVPGNLWATIEIEGGDTLQFGENIVTISVVAQNGQSTRQYKIYVTRQDDNIAAGSFFFDAYGMSYTFVELPSSYTLPDGFEEVTRTINGYNVTVFERPGLSSLLVYAYDGVNEPCFFFYDPITNIATKYDATNFVIMPSRVLTVVSVPAIVKIPDGFYPVVLEIDGVEISGYQNDDGVFLAYMKDESGSAEFYRYDETNGRFVDYKSIDKTLEKVYRILFNVFLVFTMFEAIIIIVIVCVIRRVIIIRSNPKPRRV